MPKSSIERRAVQPAETGPLASAPIERVAWTRPAVRRLKTVMSGFGSTSGFDGSALS